MLEAQARALRHIETLDTRNRDGAGQPLRCDPGCADPLAWHADRPAPAAGDCSGLHKHRRDWSLGTRILPNKRGSMMSEQDEIRRRFDDLGQWFHNIEFEGRADCARPFPGRLSQRQMAALCPRPSQGSPWENRARYRLQRRLLLDRDEAKGRRPRGRYRHESDYLEQARFAAEICGSRSNSGTCRSTTWRSSGERFDLVIFMGVFYHLRHPLLALDLIHEHVARTCFCSSRCSAAAPKSSRWSQTIRSPRTKIFDRPDFPNVLRREAVFRRSDELVDSESRLRRSDAAQRGFRDHRSSGGGSLPLPSGESGSADAGAVYPARGGEHDRSGDALERAQQHVPLGFRSSIPDWTDLRARWRSSRPKPCAPKLRDLPRVLGGISPIDPAFIANMAGKGCSIR